MMPDGQHINMHLHNPNILGWMSAEGRQIIYCNGFLLQMTTDKSLKDMYLWFVIVKMFRKYVTIFDCFVLQMSLTSQELKAFMRNWNVQIHELEIPRRELRE